MIKKNKPTNRKKKETEEMLSFLKGEYDTLPEEFEYEIHTGFSRPIWYGVEKAESLFTESFKQGIKPLNLVSQKNQSQSKGNLRGDKRRTSQRHKTVGK